MCGIYGCFSFNHPNNHPEIEVHQALIDLLSRRGPDDQGCWTDQNRCTLGFRRLSILDLSKNGSQPMFTGDHRYGIVYNGEMYNFPELKQKLGNDVADFGSTGDCAVVLYALAEWGTRAFDSFNGMFALGFYDRVEKRLLLARDHAGMKPMYYTISPNGVVFSSQFDVILRHPWNRNSKISQEALALYLRLGYIPAPYSILEGTYMLEPGCWIQFDSNGTQKSGRFFQFPSYREPDLHGQEAYEAVDAAVTSAVKRHLLSDVPVGSFLSGGIDSPLINAKMCAIGSPPFRAFTIGTNGDELDETPDAIQYARELGIDPVIEHVTPEQAVLMIDDVIAACAEPFADYSVFPTMLLSRLAAREVKVLLSGDGGDELFWGYIKRGTPILEESSSFRHPRWLRTLNWGLKKFFNVGEGDDRLRYNNIGEWHRSVHTHMPSEWAKDLFFDVGTWPAEFKLYEYNGSDPDQTAQWLRWNEFTGHLTMVLLKVDRASMYHSLEVRVPLLDREVIELAMRVDWKSCLNLDDGVGKIPLRKSLKRHLTHQTHVKRGFGVPMESWFRGPLRSIFNDFVLDRKEILGFPLNRTVTQKILDLHLTEEFELGRALWTILSLALWEEKFVKNSSLVPVCK